MEIQVGQQFSSFRELKRAVRSFSLETRAHYSLRDCKRIKNYRTYDDKIPREKLVYYRLVYACVHGGRQYEKSKRALFLRQTKTFKLGCEAVIRVTLSKDRQKLEVKKMFVEHNHPVNDILFLLHPRARQPTSSSSEYESEENDSIPREINVGNVTLKEIKVEPELKVKCEIERRGECAMLCNDLAEAMSKSSGASYEEKINFIKDLINCWKNGKRIISISSTPPSISNESMNGPATSIESMKSDDFTYYQNNTDSISESSSNDYENSIQDDNRNTRNNSSNFYKEKPPRKKRYYRPFERKELELIKKKTYIW